MLILNSKQSQTTNNESILHVMYIKSCNVSIGTLISSSNYLLFTGACIRSVSVGFSRMYKIFKACVLEFELLYEVLDNTCLDFCVFSLNEISANRRRSLFQIL